ncbi:hypothetical protein [Mycobacterium intracellulare]|uniref:hypothetical protein n=1 Tax=Mycobacterium intracellulare TaxID=1767 RepID=UPI00080B9620|nr:hypothetical protein [Mycobacterium intracellulare]OCB18023.1 hypothetical protein A5644_21750 [Mycobacterium intracellulare subsp. yongonense]
MGQIEHAMDPVRRVLGRKVSIGGLIELAVWLAIPYLCIGFAWTVFHPEDAPYGVHRMFDLAHHRTPRYRNTSFKA